MKNILLSIALLLVINSIGQRPTGNTINIQSMQNDIQQLQYQNQRTQGLYQDKAVDTSKLLQKTISQELSLPKVLDVLIDMSSDLTIRTWNESKIKIETTIQFQGENLLKDAEWLEKMGINMRVFGSTIRVKSKANSSFTDITSRGQTRVYTAPLFSGDGRYLTWEIGYRPVTLYIPTESIVEVEAQQGFLTIKDNIKRLLVTNNNCQIDVANVDRLQLRGKQGSFSGGIISDGDIQVSHGRVFINQLNSGSLTTNYSTVEIESAKDIELNSSNDEIEIDNASILYGIKNYGSLRVNQLAGKIDLQGINSDIKLRHISPSAQLVKIVNRNADLRLSSNELSNFSVDIKGSYNKVYSSFSENTRVDTLTSREVESIKAVMNAFSSGSIAAVGGGGKTLGLYSTNSSNEVIVTGYGTGGNKQSSYLKYSAKIGTGSPLTYEIICTTCIIDFK